MKSYSQFLREVKKEKTAVVTFGRMNPPTIGHQKLVDNVLRVAKQNSADPFVFLSHTQKKDKDLCIFLLEQHRVASLRQI